MNRFAYRTTGFAIKMLSSLSKAKFKLYGTDNIPSGSIIFVINHFTRIETLLMPYYIFKLTKVPVWSLATYEIFKGPLAVALDKVGAISTKNPDRDRLIVKTLLTGEAFWIIFPEGRMVKNQKIIEKGRYMISYAGGKHPPHTGAAILAMRTEFYRQRLRHLLDKNPAEANDLLDLFQIESIDPVFEKKTYIVPVNITYYPIRAKENILSSLASRIVEDIPERAVEEIMTEGSMLLSGVDIDIRFGEPIDIEPSLQCKPIQSDVTSKVPIRFDDPLPSLRRMRKEALDIMQRYMTAIYGMTTVNHDHLFASMLRTMPFRSIDAHDLRRRVFLATSLIRREPDINLHHSLYEDQLHLITDDRHNKVKDFIDIALEKGILKKDGNKLIKDSSKFSSPYNFHRARIDNPVEVMANAVEPLTALQRLIRKLAWLPGFWLKRKIAYDLSRKAQAEFESDYQTYFVQDESKEKNVGAPYLLRGNNKDIGVLLIHGYMAAPLEVKELALFLKRRGLTIYAPRVKGHGTSPDDLAKRSYREWLHSVEVGYAIVQNLCKRVVVGGFSNGAGLALDLAARIEGLAGVIAVSTPLKLQYISTKLVPAVDVWNRLMGRVHFDDARKQFVENHPENPHINYLRNPISGLRELERLMDAVEPRLPDISIPALIIQAYQDPVVSPKGSEIIFERLGSPQKSYMLFNFDRHGILRGEGAEQVHRVIWDFIAHL
jgi:esterase/lipase/1-acyl-sn-glycerol-3-phosphate acyltransferase